MDASAPATVFIRSQSHHIGIEIVPLFKQILLQFTLNRTILELKSSQNAVRLSPIDPLNRTILELKYTKQNFQIGNH